MIRNHLLATILFCLVALLSFSCWAFGGSIFRSELVLYIACTVVFLGLGGIALAPGRSGHDGGILRFSLHFAAGYICYAACWTIAWFSIPTTFGEVIGSAVGILAFTALLRRSLGGRVPLLDGTALVYFFHTVGYYAGGIAYAALQGRGPLGIELDLSPDVVRQIARLSWGLGYGLGMGAGIQALLYRARSNSESPSTQI